MSKNHPKGTTFIELLIYIAIFLILVPVLITVAINSARQERQHVVEKQVNSDSQFVTERIYDLIASAKKIDVNNSLLDEADGKLALIMQDDSTIIIQRNPLTNQVEINEGGEAHPISSDDSVVESLYFEKITDNINDPEIVLGINTRLNITGLSSEDEMQNYTISTNLERGDFDGDGCPDFKDRFPRHAECCGDGDDDGICNEKDNCILKYNPFQEDFDDDGIGDACDAELFLGEGVGSNSGEISAFNCSSDAQLIELIQQDPPLHSSQLKQILMSSSPLPSTVLQALIDAHPALNNGHFRQVFVSNVKLPSGIYDEVVAMDLPFFHKLVIYAADEVAEYVPWLGLDNQDTITYSTEITQESCNEQSYNSRIRFYDSSTPLGTSNSSQKIDTFIFNVLDAAEITVTTATSQGTATSTLSGGGDFITDDLGFTISVESVSGNNYAIGITSAENTHKLDWIEFYFGCGAIINTPSASSYQTNRYVSYCEGGCVQSCGDVGTGILTDNIYTDRCYKWNWFLPEWCSKWYTFGDNDTENPAFIGGTEVGEESLYWEKTFKAILTQAQLDELKSITIGGEVAYQSIAQFFCDTLNSVCKMDGYLVDGQNVELYNWDTESWEVIGQMGLNADTSDQQIFEIVYNGTNPQRFVGGDGNRLIKGRMEFHWNGVPPEGENKSAAFMLIDYFTAHLKW